MDMAGRILQVIGMSLVGPARSTHAASKHRAQMMQTRQGCARSGMVGWGMGKGKGKVCQ